MDKEPTVTIPLRVALHAMKGLSNAAKLYGDHHPYTDLLKKTSDEILTWVADGANDHDLNASMVSFRLEEHSGGIVSRRDSSDGK